MSKPKESLWEKFLGLFIEKPKNKKIKSNIIQINELEKEPDIDSQIKQSTKEEIKEQKVEENEKPILEEIKEQKVEENERPIVEETIKEKNEEEIIKEEKEVPINNDNKREYKEVDYASMLEKQEERIKNTNYTESEKQQMIDELYKNFETYVGETNNSKKTR